MAFDGGNFGSPEPPQDYPGQQRPQQPLRSPKPTFQPPGAPAFPATPPPGAPPPRAARQPGISLPGSPIRPLPEISNADWDRQLDLDGGGSRTGLIVAGLVALVTLVVVGGVIFVLATRVDETAAESTVTSGDQAAPAVSLAETPPDPGSSPGSDSQPGAIVVGWPELLEGDCTADRLLDGTSVNEITVMSCSEEHIFEVFAVISPFTEGTPFPGAETVRTTAETECDREFNEFYGAPVGTGGYQFVTLYAESEISWKRSESIACLIGDIPQTTSTGSLRGTGA